MIGIIGTGNMGGAMCRSIIKGGGSAVIAGRNAAKTAALAADTGAAVAADNRACAAGADAVMLCVKPDVVPAVMAEIAPVLGGRPVISVAAGVSVAALRALGAKAVVRLMPNTPAAIGRGMIISCCDEAGADTAKQLCRILEAAGNTVAPMPEKLFSAAGTASGCTPAYAYMFIESLADGAVRAGVPRADAIKLAAAAVEGAAAMVLETGRHPDELKDAVCSPGGTTIAGVAALEEHGFRAAAAGAVYAAYIRTEELTK